MEKIIEDDGQNEKCRGHKNMTKSQNFFGRY